MIAVCGGEGEITKAKQYSSKGSPMDGAPQVWRPLDHLIKDNLGYYCRKTERKVVLPGVEGEKGTERGDCWWVS